MPSRPSPSRFSRSSVVFTVVAVLALGSTIVTTGVGGGAQARFGEARARTYAECMDGESARAAASSAPCELDTASVPALREYKLRRQELDAADAALRAGDRAGGVARLAQVLERADAIDARHSLVASLLVGKLIDGVEARVHADPSLLDEPRLAAALGRMSYSSSRRPLAAERLHALAVLARVPSQVPVPTGGFVDARATDAMKEVDGTLGQMDAALLAKDVSGCEKAAQRTRGLAAQVTSAGICRVAVHVVESRERLETMRAHAVARGAQSGAAPVRRL